MECKFNSFSSSPTLSVSSFGYGRHVFYEPILFNRKTFVVWLHKVNFVNLKIFVYFYGSFFLVFNVAPSCYLSLPHTHTHTQILHYSRNVYSKQKTKVFWCLFACVLEIIIVILIFCSFPVFHLGYYTSEIWLDIGVK